MAIAAHDGRRFLRHLTFADVVPTDALPQIEHHQGFRLVAAKRVAMHSHALRSRQFDEHIRLAQFHGVIARADRFRSVAERHLRTLKLLLTAVFSANFRNGQQGNVAEVADACAAQVLMAETDEHRVAVVIARAPVPTARRLRRTELYVAKRHVGTEKNVAVAARSDARIDKLREIVAFGKGCNARQQGDCRQKKSFHIASVVRLFFVVFVEIWLKVTISTRKIQILFAFFS